MSQNIDFSFDADIYYREKGKGLKVINKKKVYNVTKDTRREKGTERI